MKRLGMTIWTVLLIVLSVSTVSAFSSASEGPHSLARYMPDSVDIFAASRINQDFVREMDAYILSLTSKLPAFIQDEPMTLSQAMRESALASGQDYDQLMQMLGDYAAMGMAFPSDPANLDGFQIWAIIEIIDQNGINSVLQSQNSPNLPPSRLDGDTIVYNVPDENLKFMITPTHLVMTTEKDFSLDILSPLSTNTEFKATLETLPADDYHVLFYMSESVIQDAISSNDSAYLTEVGLSWDGIGAVGGGFTILEDNIFALDATIQTITPMSVPDVNSDFLNNFPASTDMLFVATDMTNLYNVVFDLARTSAELSGEPDPTKDIIAGLSVFGIDLQDDFFSWTTGNYGWFIGVDVDSIAEDITDNSTLTSIENMMSGYIIETNDPATTEAFLVKIGELADLLLRMQDVDDIEIKQTTLDGRNALLFSLSAPVAPFSPPIDMELIATVIDNTLFYGTRNAYEEITNGNTLAADANFQRAIPTFLENPSTVTYINSDPIVLFLALATPLAEDYFDQLTVELAGGAPLDSNPPSVLDSNQYLELYVVAFDWIHDIWSNFTISTSVDDSGVIRMRGTLAYNE